jgi:protein-S-isoprenylcysteine O-methyltransferase Ste14
MTPSEAVIALVTVFILSWLVSAMWAGQVSASMPPGPQRPLYGAALVALVAIFGAGWLVPGWDQRLWPELPAFEWVMVAVCAAGFAFCWWARIHLGHLWSAVIDAKTDHRVVDSGPYGIVRHPIYTCAIIAAIAFAAVRGRPASILLAFWFGIVFSLKARLEERFLRGELGPAYDEYSRRVPRLVPFTRTGAMTGPAETSHGS